MKLVTPTEAASTVYVTRGMIAYWIRKGRLKKHPIQNNKRRYLVDLDEVRQAQEFSRVRFNSQPENNLVTPKEAAEYLWVGIAEIRYYARMGYIKKHYVLGNDYHYLVDLDEVKAQPFEMKKRIESRKPILREYALNHPKDDRGWFIKKDKNGQGKASTN